MLTWHFADGAVCLSLIPRSVSRHWRRLRLSIRGPADADPFKAAYEKMADEERRRVHGKHPTYASYASADEAVVLPGGFHVGDSVSTIK